MAADKTLADNIELPASSEFEGKDTFVNMYMSELDGTTTIHVRNQRAAIIQKNLCMTYMLMIRKLQE